MAEYNHAGNDFDNAEIELSGDGAEAEKSSAESEKNVDDASKEGDVDDATNEADAATSDKDQDEEGEEDEDGDKQPSGEEAKRKPRYERRIDKLTARNRELEERLERLEAGKPDPEHRGKEADKPSDAKPDLTDFDTYEDYVEALVDWKAEQKLKSRDEKAKASTAEADFNSRLAEGAKAFADWDDVVTSEVKISGDMAAAIGALDDPAPVIYYLGSNPEEAAAIKKLPPIRQITEIAKIEVKVGKTAAEDTKPAKKTTNAPPPVTPPKGSDTKTEKSVEDMDADEYIRHVNKKMGIGSVHGD